MQKTIKLIVYGRVQGVWYRRSVKKLANSMGIFGTVKNLQNGNVEIIVNLNDKFREIFISGLYRGSPFSDVKDIEIKEISVVEFNDFQII